MAKKKQPENYLDQLAQHSFGEAEPEAKSGKTPTIEELQAQISALTTKLDAQGDRFVSALTRPDMPTVQLPIPPGEINLTGLPDPMEDKDGYSKALNDRIQANIIARQQYEAQMAEAEEQQYAIAEGQIDGLWADFQQSHADLAKYPNRVRHMAQDVVEQAQQRGVDVQSYMFKTPDRFFADVVKAYESEYGKPVEKDDGLPDGRTDGVGGGDFLKGDPKMETEGAKYDFVKELKSTQAKSGFF